MTTKRSFDRAAAVLGLASIASAVFAWQGLGDFRFITITGPAVAVAFFLGVLALVAGMLAVRALALLAGLGFAVAALLQLIATTTGGDWLGADLSAMSFWLGLAVGLILVGAAPKTAAHQIASEGN